MLVKHPRIISLTAAMWVHAGAVRRFATTHHAVGPKD